MVLNTVPYPTSRFFHLTVRSKAMEREHIIHEYQNIDLPAELQKILQFSGKQNSVLHTTCNQKCLMLSFIQEKSGA